MRVPWRNSAQLLPGFMLCAFSVAVTVHLFVLSWNEPVRDMYGFRQAQTALSAYWLGGEKTSSGISPP